MIDWDKIDEIEPENNYEKFQPKERRKITPSVGLVLDLADKILSDTEQPATEEDFHQINQKVMDMGKSNYLQKALRTTLRWQSFCQANP